MSACPACGRQGETTELVRPGYILVLCPDCGFGRGLRPITGPGRNAKEPVSDIPAKETDTGSIQLSPTAAHPTVDIDNPPSPAGKIAEENSVSVQPHPICIVSTDQAMISAMVGQFEARGGGLTAEPLDTGGDLISQRVNALQGERSISVICIDADLSDFPAMELGFAIRALEAAFGEQRTPLVFIGADNEDYDAACKQLGKAHCVSNQPGNDSVEAVSNMVQTLCT